MTLTKPAKAQQPVISVPDKFVMFTFYYKLPAKRQEFTTEAAMLAELSNVIKDTRVNYWKVISRVTGKKDERQ